MFDDWDWRWAWQGVLRDTIDSLPPLPPVEARNQFTFFHEEFTPMAYPKAVYTGNAVIAAALALDDAMEAETWRVGVTLEEAMARIEADAYGTAKRALREAVAAHRAATAAEHVQGPDLDADRHGGQP